MVKIVSIGEKSQIVIPKKIQQKFKLTKSTKLLIKEDKDRIIIKSVKLDDDHLSMLLGESSLKKTWGNKYDVRWDEVL